MKMKWLDNDKEFGRITQEEEEKRFNRQCIYWSLLFAVMGAICIAIIISLEGGI